MVIEDNNNNIQRLKGKGVNISDDACAQMRPSYKCHVKDDDKVLHYGSLLCPFNSLRLYA